MTKTPQFEEVPIRRQTDIYTITYHESLDGLFPGITIRGEVRARFVPD